MIPEALLWNSSQLKSQEVITHAQILDAVNNRPSLVRSIDHYPELSEPTALPPPPPPLTEEGAIDPFDIENSDSIDQFRSCIIFFGGSNNSMEEEHNIIRQTNWEWADYENPTPTNKQFLQTPGLRAQAIYRIVTQEIPPDAVPQGPLLDYQIQMNFAAYHEEELENTAVRFILETQSPGEPEPTIIFDRNMGEFTDFDLEWTPLEVEMSEEELSLFQDRVHNLGAFSRLRFEVHGLPLTLAATDRGYADDLDFWWCAIKEPEETSYLPMVLNNSNTANSTE
ncbi:hypothetical protein HY468_05390 [Candidatus Roizmanbacteria bacterium]|nr:hypothetical protein [Candidatus Roizmanbacteria bacterium]